MRKDKQEELNTLRLLEELASKLNIEIQYVSLIPQYSEGGLVRIIDKRRFLVDKGLATQAKIEVLAKNLKLLDLSNIFIPPSLKGFFEG